MRENGFTLVELLFAMVAGGLLLVGIGWALRGLEARYRHDLPPSPTEQVEAIDSFLTTEVGRARPPASGMAFAGSDHHLLLTVPPPEALGPVGLVRLDLAVKPTDHGQSLMAQILPLTGISAQASNVTRPVTLADGFADIRFVYTRRSNDPPTALPRLITFQFLGRDGTVIPLGVEPRLTMAADCLFDSISLACRP